MKELLLRGNYPLMFHLIVLKGYLPTQMLVDSDWNSVDLLRLTVIISSVSILDHVICGNYCKSMFTPCAPELPSVYVNSVLVEFLSPLIFWFPFCSVLAWGTQRNKFCLLLLRSLKLPRTRRFLHFGRRSCVAFEKIKFMVSCWPFEYYSINNIVIINFIFENCGTWYDSSLYAQGKKLIMECKVLGCNQIKMVEICQTCVRWEPVLPLYVNYNSFLLHLFLRYVMMRSQTLSKIWPRRNNTENGRGKRKLFWLIRLRLISSSSLWCARAERW